MRAPTTPPDTGASRKPTCLAAASAARACTTVGEFVERSTMTEPAAAPESTPSGPDTTASTSGGVGSDRKVTVAASATVPHVGGPGGARPEQVLARLPMDVGHREGVPGPQQVGGHRVAHVARTYESETHGRRVGGAPHPAPGGPPPGITAQGGPSLPPDTGSRACRRLGGSGG